MDALRRTALWGTLLAAVATAAACGGDAPDVVVIGPDEPVQVRTLLSGTGASPSGVTSRLSVEMAVEHFGRIHGHEIELGPPVDGMCSPEGGSAGAERIVADSKVLGIIGTSCSGAAVAASPIVSEAGLVMVSPSNTAPVLTSDLRGNAGSSYHPGYFRVSNNDLSLGQAVAAFAYDDLGLRRMTAVHDGDPYTSGLAGAFADAFRARGGEVPVVSTVEKGQTDMTGVLAEFASAGPDGVFLPLFTAEATHFAAQVREFDALEGAALISGDGALGSEFLALPESEGIYFAGPSSEEGGNFNIATGNTAQEAHDAFVDRYGEPASPYWAYAYDAATLLLAAIERAAVPDDGTFFTRLLGIDARGTLRVDRSALRGAVLQVSRGEGEGFSGLTGRLSCDEFGDCGAGVQAIYHHPDPSVTDPEELSIVYRFEP